MSATCTKPQHTEETNARLQFSKGTYTQSLSVEMALAPEILSDSHDFVISRCEEIHTKIPVHEEEQTTTSAREQEKQTTLKMAVEVKTRRVRR